VIDWGNVPSYLTGVLTAGALVFTAVGLRRETNKTRQERLDRDQERRRSQAAHVAAWTDRMGPPDEDDLKRWAHPNTWETDTSAISWVVTIRIRNASELPIYQISYSLSAGMRGTFVGRIYSLAPASTIEILIPLTSAPRSEWTTPIVAFQDCDGVQWWRTETGLLHEGQPEPGTFEMEPAAYGTVANHPTLTLAHPKRIVDAGAHPRAGRVTLPGVATPVRPLSERTDEPLED
jgi:hypothetical protein